MSTEKPMDLTDPMRATLAEMGRQSAEREIISALRNSSSPVTRFLVKILPHDARLTLAQLVFERDLRYIGAEARALKYQELAETDSKTGLPNEVKYIKDRETILSDLLLNDRNALSQNQNSTFFVRVDAGLLGMFNDRGGHRLGDTLKMAIAYVIEASPGKMRTKVELQALLSSDEYKRALHVFKNFRFFSAYGLGGDENAMLIRGPRDMVIDFFHMVDADLISNKNRNGREMNRKFISDLLDYEPRLLLDYGIEEVTPELLRDLEQLFVNSGAKDESKAAFIAEAIDMIADRKTFISKALKRIHLFANIRKTNPELFDDVYHFASKGAFGISPSELDAITRYPDIESQIKFFIQSKLAERDRKSIQDEHGNLFIAAMYQYLLDHTEAYIYV